MKLSGPRGIPLHPSAFILHPSRGPLRAAGDPAGEVGDLSFGQLLAGGHFGGAAFVAEGGEEEARFGVAGDEGPTAGAALEEGGAAVDAQAAALLLGAVALAAAGQQE